MCCSGWFLSVAACAWVLVDVISIQALAHHHVAQAKQRSNARQVCFCGFPLVVSSCVRVFVHVGVCVCGCVLKLSISFLPSNLTSYSRFNIFFMMRQGSSVALLIVAAWLLREVRCWTRAQKTNKENHTVPPWFRSWVVRHAGVVERGNGNGSFLF